MGVTTSSASRLPAGNIVVHYTTSCNTQSSAPEYGRDHFFRLQATGQQQRGCIIPQAVTHSLVHLKMGVIISSASRLPAGNIVGAFIPQAVNTV